MSVPPVHKKYEEYVYVIDFLPRSRSNVIPGREGPIMQAIGEERLTLLEILALPNVSFEVGDRVYVGKEGRTKIVSVLGRLEHGQLNNEAKEHLQSVAETIVRALESRFVSYFNQLQPITPRLHGLELIPGIGKTYMMEIIKEREKKPFESFADIQNRTKIREPARLIARRIVEELSGASRINLFARK